jgi:hypothetical protein
MHLGLGSAQQGRVIDGRTEARAIRSEDIHHRLRSRCARTGRVQTATDEHSQVSVANRALPQQPHTSCAHQRPDSTPPRVARRVTASRNISAARTAPSPAALSTLPGQPTLFNSAYSCSTYRG